jgi:nucleoside phosphorylase
MSMEKPERVLIATALPLERTAILSHLQDTREERLNSGTLYELGKFLSVTVCVVEVTPGNSSAALETERAISHFNPNVALFVGIAGGVKDVNLGDVVAASKVYGYEAGADREHFQPRPDIGLSSYPLVQEAYAVAREAKWTARIKRINLPSQPRAFVGPIAAGAKVVKSSQGNVANLLRQAYGDTLAVEMEGEGFLRAAYANRVDAMVVRGISDLLDRKAEADAAGSQEIAADNAAAFAFELIARIASRAIVDVATQILSQGKANQARPAPHDPSDFWSRLRELAPRLYPRGPDDNNIWVDAGGDLSFLDLSGNARTQWSRAVRLIENGGGDVTASQLLEFNGTNLC